MNFLKNALLNYDQLESLINSDSPNEGAEIIVDKLKNYIFLNNGEYYKFDLEKIVYKKISHGVDDAIISIITSYITKSISNLNKEQMELLKLKYNAHSVINLFQCHVPQLLNTRSQHLST
jgi:3-isopropylmalate dehydratase small subunit